MSLAHIAAVNVKQSSIQHQQEQQATREKTETQCQQLYDEALRWQMRGSDAHISVEEADRCDYDALRLYLELLNVEQVKQTALVPLKTAAQTGSSFVDDNKSQMTLHEKQVHHQRRIQKNTFLYLKFLALKNMAAIYMRQGLLRDALRCFSRALLIDDTDAHTWFNYGLCATKCGEYGVARMALEHAAAQEPNDVRTLQQLVRVLFVVCDFGACCLVARQLLSLQSENTLTRCIIDECISKNPVLLGIVGREHLGALFVCDSDLAVLEQLRTGQQLFARKSMASSVQKPDNSITVIKLKEHTWQCLGRRLLMLFRACVNQQKDVNCKVRILLVPPSPPVITTSSDELHVVPDSQEDILDMASQDSVQIIEDEEMIQAMRRKRNAAQLAAAQSDAAAMESPQVSEPLEAEAVARRSKRQRIPLNSSSSSSSSKKDQDAQIATSIAKLIEDKSLDSSVSTPLDSQSSDFSSPVVTMQPQQFVATEELDQSTLVAVIALLNSQFRDSAPGLLDVMRIFVEVLCTEYWQYKWPDQLIPQVRIIAVKLLERGIEFSTATCIALGELLLDKAVTTESSAKSARPSKLLFFARKLINSISSRNILDSKHVSRSQSLRIHWLLSHLERQARNIEAVKQSMLLVRCELSQLRGGQSEFVIPNLNNNNRITESLLETKLQEFDYINSIDRAKASLRQSRFVDCVRSLLPVLGRLPNKHIEQQVQQLLVQSFYGAVDVYKSVFQEESRKAQTANSNVYKLLSLLLNAIQPSMVKSETSNASKILRNLNDAFSVFGRAQFGDDQLLTIRAELYRIAAIIDDQTEKAPFAQFFARVETVLYRIFAGSASLYKRYTFLRELRVALIHLFKLHLDGKAWIFKWLFEEQYQIYDALQSQGSDDKDEDGDETMDGGDAKMQQEQQDKEEEEDDEDKVELKEVESELAINFYILYGIKISSAVRPEIVKVEGKKVPLKKDKKAATIALRLLRDSVNQALLSKATTRTDRKREVVRTLNQFKGTFKGTPAAVQPVEAEIQKIIDGIAWDGSVHNEQQAALAALNVAGRLQCSNENNLDGYALLNMYLGRLQNSIEGDQAAEEASNDADNGSGAPGVSLGMHINKNLAESISTLERACAFAPNLSDVWSHLAVGYQTIAELLSDVQDVVEAHGKVLVDPAVRKLLRLSPIPAPTDAAFAQGFSYTTQFLSDYSICRERSIFCFTLADRFRNQTKDEEDDDPLFNEGLCLFEAVLFAQQKATCLSAVGTTGELIAGLTQEEALVKAIKCFERCMAIEKQKEEDKYDLMYPLMAARAMQLLPNKYSAREVATYFSMAVDLERKTSAQNSSSDPQYLLQSLRLQLLDRAEKQNDTSLLVVVKEFRAILHVKKEEFVRAREKKSFFDLITKIPSFAAEELKALVQGNEFAPHYDNIWIGLLEALKKNEHDYRVLCAMVECVTRGPWKNWKQALAMLQLLVKSKSMSAAVKKPDTFTFEPMRELDQDLFDRQKHLRAWRAKVLNHFAQVLRHTRSFDVLSMLCAGIRRQFIVTEPYMLDSYRQLLCSFAAALQEERPIVTAKAKQEQEPTPELQVQQHQLARYVFECYVYVHDKYWDADSDISALRKPLSKLKDDSLRELGLPLDTAKNLQGVINLCKENKTLAIDLTDAKKHQARRHYEQVAQMLKTLKLQKSAAEATVNASTNSALASAASDSQVSSSSLVTGSGADSFVISPAAPVVVVAEEETPAAAATVPEASAADAPQLSTPAAHNGTSMEDAIVVLDEEDEEDEAAKVAMRAKQAALAQQEAHQNFVPVDFGYVTSDDDDSDDEDAEDSKMLDEDAPATVTPVSRSQQQSSQGTTGARSSSQQQRISPSQKDQVPSQPVPTHPQQNQNNVIDLEEIDLDEIDDEDDEEEDEEAAAAEMAEFYVEGDDDDDDIVM